MVQVFADEKLVYDSRLNGYELLTLTATVSVEKAGTAELTLPPNHPAYNDFVCYRTVVTIYRNDELIFRGRALYTTDDFHNNRKVTCEGERCFLRDAVIQPYLYQADPAVIFSDVIERYNRQVEPFKRFRVGAITAKDPNNYQRIECESASQVSDVIDKLTEYVGGYVMFTTAADGQRVINWYGSMNRVSKQKIEFGENLLDFSRSGVNTDLATVLYPYGAKDEVTGKRVTIETVNSGNLYIQDDEAVARYGTIAVPVFWDDVTQPKNLLTKARKELNTRKLIVTTLELSAVDLSTQDIDIDSLKVGDNVQVCSLPHGLDDTLLLSSRTYELLEFGQDRVVLGKELATLTRADVMSNRNTLNQLQRTEQSIKTDYEIKISDAINSLRR